VGAKFFSGVAVPGAPVYDFVFDPQGRWVKDKSDRDGVAAKINIYREPEIYKTRLINPKEVSIARTKEWLSYLFSDKEQRLYVFNWIAHALTDRAKTALILSGREGTGKTTFSKLLKGLVCGGQSNPYGYFCKGRLHARATRFNEEYNVARILFFDEYKLSTADQVDFIKELVEDDQSREGKFQARKTVSNTLSVLLCNNSPWNIKIPPATGRKMSVLDLPIDKMTDVFDSKFIAGLHKELESPECLAKIYHTLKDKFLDLYPNDQPLHTDTYEQMTLASAPQFIQDFLKFEIDDRPVTEIQPGQTWDIDEVSGYDKGKRRGDKTAESDVVTFFEHYKVSRKPVLRPIYFKGDSPKVELTTEYWEYLKSRRGEIPV
jgi:hypothetical protein